MPSSYVSTAPVTAIQGLFDRLLHHLPDSKSRTALADIYSNELGDPSIGAYALPQIRDQIQFDPIKFFALVSLLLVNPPSFLSTGDERERLAQALTIRISEFEHLRVTDTGIWVRQLTLDPSNSVSISRYEYHQNTSTTEITTANIYDYLKSAVICYHSRLLPSALALTVIAFEACLREVLVGIKRDLIPQLAPYKWSTARVEAHLDAASGEPVISFDVINSVQKIREHFKAQSPKGTKQFLDRLTFDICREDVVTNSTKRVPLRLQVDARHVDLFSTDQREPIAAQRRAKKFYEFIQAAELAGRLRARRLPQDSAEIIRKVRNNLIHWSEAALAETLSTGMTIRDYVQREDTVRTTMVDVMNFVSDEYYDFRLFERTGII